eukprot:1147385-Pelagomonas_calceolata.AAC.2
MLVQIKFANSGKLITKHNEQQQRFRQPGKKHGKLESFQEIAVVQPNLRGLVSATPSCAPAGFCGSSLDVHSLYNGHLGHLGPNLMMRGGTLAVSKGKWEKKWKLETSTKVWHSRRAWEPPGQLLKTRALYVPTYLQLVPSFGVGSCRIEYRTKALTNKRAVPCSCSLAICKEHARFKDPQASQQVKTVAWCLLRAEALNKTVFQSLSWATQ